MSFCYRKWMFITMFYHFSACQPAPNWGCSNSSFHKCMCVH